MLNKVKHLVLDAHILRFTQNDIIHKENIKVEIFSESQAKTEE